MGSSHWHPFRRANAVSGHAYIGAIPFITAAQMTDKPVVKGLFYVLSTVCAWSRINDDAHYLSQAVLGWYLAYLSVRAVTKTESRRPLPRGLTIFPLSGAGVVGIPVKKLDLGYYLTVPIYYMPGAGAYLVNRKAAERMIKFLLPMYLPWDHAFEQNWRMGLTTMMVVPFPIELNEHKSHSVIGTVDGLAGGSRHDRLPFLQRYLLSPVLPYRGLMTCQRWRKQLGTALWYRLFPPQEPEV